ncbi:hypothetical protein AAE478_000112 [Parahypoxylon ruwenzoriense]
MSNGNDIAPDVAGLSAPFDTAIILSPITALAIDGTLESLLNSMPGGGFGDTQEQSDPLRQDTPVTSSSMGEVISVQDYSKMLPVCDDYAPWQLADSSTRIAYTMSVFKNLHVTFARDNCTIYMHRHLYRGDVPRWIFQAFSVCVLYTNLTEANRGLVLRALHENTIDLVRAAGGTALTPREKLARVHALIVYQTIRLFDGDITLGQQAENDMPLLETWTNELGKLRDNLKESADMDVAGVRGNPPKSWERWLFAECVRRTYIVSSGLKTFWEILKCWSMPDVNELGNWQYIHRWTLSKHLWDAMNPLDFFQAWKEKPFWIITAFDFNDFLRTGTGNDVDDFALLFLTLWVYKGRLIITFGVDEIKRFCYETSGRRLT